MRTFFKIIFLFVALMFVAALIGGTMAWSELGSLHDHATISINGETLDIADFHDGGHWFGTVLGLFIAGLVICLVVPFVLLLSVGLPLLIVALVFGSLLLAVAGVGAVVFSPFVLFVLFAVWLLRRISGSSKAAAPKANIAA